MFERLYSALSVALIALMLFPVAPAAQAQTLYEADFSGGSVYAFTSNGIRSTVISGFTLGDVAVDSKGNLFVDGYGKGILKITPGGNVSVFATNFSFFDNGIAVDRNDNLFVTDTSQQKIVKIAPDGTQTDFVFNTNGAADVAFDHAGNVYVSNLATDTIDIYTPDGKQKRTFIQGPISGFGLAFDSHDNLFVSDYITQSILKFAPDGTQSTFTPGLNNFGPFDLDNNDNIFVANAASHSIYKITPDGTQSVFAVGVDAASHLAFSPFSVPEPSSISFLTALSFIGATFLRRRKQARGQTIPTKRH